MSAWELRNITALVLLPPGCLIIVGLVGVSLIRARIRLGASLVIFSLVALYVLSMPLVSRKLVQAIEYPYTDPTADRSGGAIVVLGGGSYFGAPEYGGDTVSKETLERLRYGAYLHRHIGTPILVTSGNPAGGSSTEADQMKAALRDFGVITEWVEGASNNTFENAIFTQRRLKEAGVASVYLVTHAWHMPRTKRVFERAGLRVIPAPLGYTTAVRVMALDFLPSASGMGRSFIFFHETAGRIWYRLQSIPRPEARARALEAA